MTYITDSKYTAYVWVNWLYMNEKQWGIQTAHCISDMSMMQFGKDAYETWASNHKTIIMFNGTNSGTIKQVHAILGFAVRNLKRRGIHIPHVLFREDGESLDGAVTSCAVILPDEIRQTPWDTSFGEPYDVTTEFMMQRVIASDAKHKVYSEQRAFAEYKNYVDYSHDEFYMHEFAAWMNRQRLA